MMTREIDLLRQNRGFSLLEIMVCIGILAIIFAVAFPVLVGQRTSARLSKNLADVTSAAAVVVSASAINDGSLLVEEDSVTYSGGQVSSLDGTFLLVTPMTETGFFCLQLTDREGMIVHSTPSGSATGSCEDGNVLPAAEPEVSPPPSSGTEYSGPIITHEDFAIESVSRIAPPAGVFSIRSAYTGGQYSLSKYGSGEPPYEGTIETSSFLIGVPYVYPNDTWTLVITFGPYTETYSTTIEDHDEYLEGVPPLQDPTGTTSVGMLEETDLPIPSANATPLPTMENGKVIFCQATNSSSHPYLKGKVSKQGILNGHLKKTGALYPTENWGDIIPPFDNFPGQNWSSKGQAVFNNHCLAE